MKNLLIVFLGAWVAYLLLGKKATKELAEKTVDTAINAANALTPDGQTLINTPGSPININKTEEGQTKDNSGTGNTPLIDRPIMQINSPSITGIYNETPFSNYTPAIKKHGAFNL